MSSRIAGLALCGALGALASVFVSAPASAQVPLDRLHDFLRERPGGLGAGSLRASPGTQLSGATGARWVPLSRGRGLWRVADTELRAPGLDPRRGSSELLWAPPLHLLMDRARASLALDQAVQVQGAGSGQGVVVGIVDAGIDAAHPDLRNADGTTRVAWWIDFASNPAGLHPELEAEFGCAPQSGLRCQVLSGADLNQRLSNDVRGDEPTDAIGHGTHVASIAAGNGRARQDGAYAGIAPEATLVVARVLGESGIRENDVVLASKFVFERARELGMPAVVNLSLGSDFGAHDGSSELSQLLSSLVGPEQPGRAIVVAAGNSGQLLRGVTNEASEPLGVHREVEVVPEAPRRLTLLTAQSLDGRSQTTASVFLWLNLFPASELSVGLELPDGARIEPVGWGETQTLHSAEVTAAIVHGLDTPSLQSELAPALPGLELGQLLPSPGAAVILIDGRWPAGASFHVELVGRGRAELWAQSEGDLAPEANPIGAVFASASAQQTITIPASDPALIAVGASINRLDWSDYRGQAARYADPKLDPSPVVGSAGFFSSAGPNRLGDIKPDVLAPGGFVIAALAGSADPRSGGRGVFSGLCLPLGCQVVSSEYAVTAGTSMAAPMVSGAVALLLQRSPTLTQPELLALLQTGSDALDPAPDPGSREGGGVLNIARSFAALASSPRSEDAPDASQSRLRFASDVLLADPARELSARLWLRDAAGQVFDAEPARLSLRVTGGVLSRDLERLAPGLYGFALSSPSPALADTLRAEVSVDGRSWLDAEIPVLGAVEPRAASVGGGCSVTPLVSATATSPGLPHGYAGLALLASLAGVRRRAPKR